MWLMLQQDSPGDYVAATGRAAWVREMCRIAFRHVRLDMDEYLAIDPKLFRPAEVNALLGDAAKARATLGLSPSITLEDMIGEMVEEDLRRVRAERA
jgi:GDPmannose 4,6-dehydratase